MAYIDQVGLAQDPTFLKRVQYAIVPPDERVVRKDISDRLHVMKLEPNHF